MATYIDIAKVQYGVSQRLKAPLCRLYFCRHCLKLRSSECVSHEVDSHYCPNCLENMPSAEAQLKCNRCANCFDCPSCHHTLSTRATSVAIADPENPGKSTPKKVYYLACGFCRWTSRDVGMKDQPVASGGWQNLENPHAKRISSLLDYYRQLAAKEKAEKEKKKFIRRRNYLHLDKYGLSSLSTRKKTGLIGIGSMSLKDSDDSKIQEVEPAEMVDSFEPISEDYYTQPVQLTKVCNIRQRLSNPEHQVLNMCDLHPYHKHLLIKRSQRCRQCEHNLSKPEFNPSSIKFKIQLVAIHHVPDIKIMSPPALELNKETPVVLTMLNPLDNITHVTLVANELPETGDGFTNAKVTLPSCELVLSPRDDAAEFDDSADQQSSFKDDPGVVVFRKANKIGFVIKVTPQSKEQHIRVSFLLKYDYKNMTTVLQSDSKDKEPDMVWLTHPVYIDLGPITQST